MRPAVVLRVVVAAIAVATVVGLVALWPTGDAPDLGPTAADLRFVEAEVDDVTVVDCDDPAELLPTECQRVAVELDSGPDAGQPATFLTSLLDQRTPHFEPGDDLVLTYNPLAPPDFQYGFLEFQRDAPLLALGAVFVVVVVAFGRWQGVRAIAGLAVSVAVIVGFLLPSLLRDHDAVAVALVTTSVVAFAAIYLAHGISPSTTVALLGTLASVVVIAGLAALVTTAAALSGLSEESFQVLRVTAEAIDPRGILIAGIVIGALGVLDDVTVTQVSAVAELRRADPTLAGRRLYQAAIRIGRDHVASTVNTLVLAYVGASIALLLFFFQEGRPLGQVLGSEVVAIEIVRMLIGSIGLVLSVPVTTALAVAVMNDVTTDVTTDEPRPAGHLHRRGRS